MKRLALPLLLAAVSLAAAGCARLASVTTAGLMVRAPNRTDPRSYTANRPPLDPRTGNVDGQFRVPVGPPPAELLVSILDTRKPDRPPAGTILLIHGAYGSSEDMAGPARRLADAGYRTVLVDLRGHGRSTGDRITYGVRESADMSQVLDYLQRQGLLVGNLGVYGFSFGAATAVQLAGRDPRVRAVVALAPYSSLESVARDLMPTRLPGGRFYADQAWIERTLSEAGRDAGFDYHQANAAGAIPRTRANVLLVHGADDHFVEPHNSVELYRAGYGHTKIVVIDGANHDDLIRDDSGMAASMAVDWFDRWLAGRAPGG